MNPLHTRPLLSQLSLSIPIRLLLSAIGTRLPSVAWLSTLDPESLLSSLIGTSS